MRLTLVEFDPVHILVEPEAAIAGPARAETLIVTDVVLPRLSDAIILMLPDPLLAVSVADVPVALLMLELTDPELIRCHEIVPLPTAFRVTVSVSVIELLLVAIASFFAVNEIAVSLPLLSTTVSIEVRELFCRVAVKSIGDTSNVLEFRLFTEILPFDVLHV